jgi:hypothetical protein
MKTKKYNKKKLLRKTKTKIIKGGLLSKVKNILKYLKNNDTRVNPIENLIDESNIQSNPLFDKLQNFPNIDKETLNKIQSTVDTNINNENEIIKNNQNINIKDKNVGEFSSKLPVTDFNEEPHRGTDSNLHLNKDNIRNGEGTFTVNTGNNYTSENNDNRLNGKATYTFKNGSTYTGDFKDGLKHGKGTYTFKDGSTYTGDFKDGLRDGKGIYEYTFISDTDLYNIININSDTITKVNDSIKKLYKYPWNCTYQGEWKDDKQNGKGTLKMKKEISNDKYKEITYSGDWVDNKKHGHGTYNYNNVYIYDGNWVNNKRDGIGFEITKEYKRKKNYQPSIQGKIVKYNKDKKEIISNEEIIKFLEENGIVAKDTKNIKEYVEKFFENIKRDKKRI